MLNDEQLQYPIGKFTPKGSYSAEELASSIISIEVLPEKIEAAIKGMTPVQLDAPYRKEGWTLRQVVHHLSDSHLNAYIRMKWALTEDTPTIKTYNEKAWAETAETTLDPTLSIELLKALHRKWVALLRMLKAKELQKNFFHPESKKHVRLDYLICLYAWHGEHHLAHITTLKERMQWK